MIQVILRGKKEQSVYINIDRIETILPVETGCDLYFPDGTDCRCTSTAEEVYNEVHFARQRRNESINYALDVIRTRLGK